MWHPFPTSRTSGAIEPQFYKLLIEGMGLANAGLPFQNDSDKWPEMKALFAKTFLGKTRDEWMAIFGGTDACVAPVLTSGEFLTHEHTVARCDREEHVLLVIGLTA